MKESDFQADLIKELENRFEGCLVLKNDPNYIQGIPDLLVLYKDKWAALEVKRASKANRQKNQPYYIEYMNNMSFASFVSPENKEEVMNGLQSTFEPNRPTRLSRSK